MRQKYRFRDRKEAEDAEQVAREQLHLATLALGEPPEATAEMFEPTPEGGIYYFLRAYRLGSATGGFVVTGSRHAETHSNREYIERVAYFAPFAREMSDRNGYSEYATMYAQMIEKIRVAHSRNAVA